MTLFVNVERLRTTSGDVDSNICAVLSKPDKLQAVSSQSYVQLAHMDAEFGIGYDSSQV